MLAVYPESGLCGGKSRKGRGCGMRGTGINIQSLEVFCASKIGEGNTKGGGHKGDLRDGR